MTPVLIAVCLLVLAPLVVVVVAIRGIAGYKPE
jgi:hypothetical protein